MSDAINYFCQNVGLPYGGKHIFKFGDLAQINPVFGISVYKYVGDEQKKV